MKSADWYRMKLGDKIMKPKMPMRVYVVLDFDSEPPTPGNNVSVREEREGAVPFWINATRCAQFEVVRP